MKSSQNIKLPTIDAITGLRGLAALWVVISHIWKGMGGQDVHLYGIDITPFFMGWFGVDIFFVLSGFAVFLPCSYALHNKLKISWRSFLLRRAARLFPAYQLQLLFIFILFYLGLYSTNLGTLDLVKHLFLLQNIPPSGSAGIMGIYWTLPVEMNFYLSIPLLFCLIKYIGHPASLLLIITSCVSYRYYIFNIYGENEALWLQINQLFGRLDQFIMGMSAAMIYAGLDNKSALYDTLKKNYLYGLVLGVTGILCCIYYFKSIGGEKMFYSGHPALFIFDMPLAFCIAVLIFFLTMQGRIGEKIFANKIALFLGNISYGIYLWHTLVFTMLIDHFPVMTKLNFLQEGMVGIAITIAVASLSYFLLERRLMNYVKNNWAKDVFNRNHWW